MNTIKQLGIIGCGLMGGSFALAVKRAGLAQRIVGYSKSPSTTEQAKQLGVIDEAAPSALQAASGSDVVVIAVPVSATENALKAIRDLISPSMLVMDVGSTKRDVIDAARRVLRERMASFVPCHPIAGRERSGVQHADADLYTDRHVILTPDSQTDPALVARATALWEALQSRVHLMTPHEHDATFAAVSHLPHLIAFAYLTGLLQQKEADNFLRLAGPGFRDFTRIAAADPVMWRDVLIANREEVLMQSARFRGALDVLEQTLRDCQGESLEALIKGISQARAHWRMSPPMKS